MNNKLPKIFANKIEKKIKNNEEIYTTSNKTQNLKTQTKEESSEIRIINNKIREKTISQKINEIIKANKYIYKIPVKIDLKDKQLITNIIGKNNKNIITINNELIKIEDIKNIEINEKNE